MLLSFFKILFLSLNFWKSPAESSQSVAAAISLLMLSLGPRISAVVPSQCPSCCLQAGMWAFPSPLFTPVPTSRQFQDNGGLEVPLWPLPFLMSIKSISYLSPPQQSEGGAESSNPLAEWLASLTTSLQHPEGTLLA